MPAPRAATTEDLEAIVELTRAGRRRLAEWSPGYFRPHEHADDAHAAFLAFLVESPDHPTTVVAADDGDVIGFYRCEPRPGFIWVDDLCALDDHWSDVVAAIDVDTRWTTCVSPLDTHRRAALDAAGLTVSATYWSRFLHDIDGVADIVGAAPEPSAPPAPHTFGPIDPTADGALSIVDGAGNWAVGSPGFVPPPVYDPGGPTTVVDRLGGPDLDATIQLALRATAERGDAQLVVVASATDTDLAAALDRAGFTNPIELWLRA